MKKYLLLLVVTFMIVIPGVKAEEETKLPVEGMGIANSSTKNLLKPGFGPGGFNNGNWFNISNPDERSYPCLTNFIKVEPNETYTLSKSGSTPVIYAYELDTNFKLVLNTQVSFPYTFTTEENTAYFILGSYGPLNWVNSLGGTYQLELGNEATDIVAYEEKKDTPDTPVDPISPTPTPQETDPTKILTNFYSICTSKLKLLSDEFSNNFLLLSMPVIVLLIFVFTIIWRRYIIWKNIY